MCCATVTRDGLKAKRRQPDRNPLSQRGGGRRLKLGLAPQGGQASTSFLPELRQVVGHRAKQGSSAGLEAGLPLLGVGLPERLSFKVHLQVESIDNCLCCATRSRARLAYGSSNSELGQAVLCEKFGVSPVFDD